MKKRIFLLIPFFVLTFFSQRGYAKAAPPFYTQDPLVGHYEVTGRNNLYSVKSYRGFARIEPCGENYHIVWEIAGKTVYGFGIKCGNVLAASYETQSGRLAVVAFEIGPGRILKGKWAYEGAEEFKIEVLSPL